MCVIPGGNSSSRHAYFCQSLSVAGGRHLRLSMGVMSVG